MARLNPDSTPASTQERRQLTVLFLSNGLVRIPVDKQGSPEGHITRLASELGHDSRVIVVDRLYPIDRDAIDYSVPGVTIVRIPARYVGPSRLERNLGSRLLYWMRTSVFTFFMVTRSIPLIKSAKPDVINTFAIYETFLLAIFCMGYRHRIIYNHHSSLFPGKGFASAVLSGLAIPTVRLVGGVITLNETAGRWFASVGGRPKVIPTGISIPSLSVSQQPPTGDILFVGRITDEKGVDILIRAYALLLSKYDYKGTRLLLAGPFEAAESGPRGTYTRRVTRLIQELGVASSVVLTGYIPEHELRDLYSKCDLFVLPSKIEMSSAASLEAMSYAKPIVSTRTQSALSQVRHGWNGLLVPNGDPEALADGIHYLLVHPEIRRNMGSNARTFAARREWRLIAKIHLDYYFELVDP